MDYCTENYRKWRTNVKAVIVDLKLTAKEELDLPNKFSRLKIDCVKKQKEHTLTTEMQVLPHMNKT